MDKGGGGRGGRTETSQPYERFGRFSVPSGLNSSAQDTVMDGSVTRRLRGMVRVMSLTRRVPPERTSLGSVTVALGG